MHEPRPPRDLAIHHRHLLARSEIGERFCPGPGRHAECDAVAGPAAIKPEDEALVLGRARHGVEFCAAAGRPGVTGLQFHPEKSSAAGLALLGRWLAGGRAATGAATAT